MNKTLRAVRQFAALALCTCLLAGCARVSPGSAAPSASASVPGPAAAFSAAQLPDEPLPPIEEETLDELEAFLNDSKVLSWLDPDSLKELLAGEAPLQRSSRRRLAGPPRTRKEPSDPHPHNRGRHPLFCDRGV